MTTEKPISVRLNKSEIRHLKKLAKSDGSVTQAIRNLIQASMDKKTFPVSEVFSVKTYHLLRQFVEEQSPSFSEMIANTEEAVAEELELEVY